MCRRFSLKDLLDFIQGPLATHQKRLLQLLLDWQESVLHRLPVDTAEMAHEIDESAAEMAHMLQLSEAMMALMYHLVWMTTGQDIEIKEAPDDRTVG